MIEKKKCEKCGKTLPNGYKESLCLCCKGKKDAKVKKNGLKIAGVVAAIGSAALTIIKKSLKK